MHSFSYWVGLSMARPNPSYSAHYRWALMLYSIEKGNHYSVTRDHVGVCEF